ILKYTLASATNLGVASLYCGEEKQARELLNSVISTVDDLSFVRIGALDSLAQLALFSNDIAGCASFLNECLNTISATRVPARSWYDLAHQVTRCLYLERIQNWNEVLTIAGSTDDELAKRQFMAVRVSLLCARARALAHLGQHHQADSALATAI